MKTKFALSFFTVAAMAFSAAGEVVKEIDATQKNYVVFAYNASAPGTAIVILGQGRSAKKMQVDLAYGLIVKNGKPAIGTVSDRKIKELRGKKGQPESHALIVQVSSSQYENARKVVERWSAKETLQHPPIVSCTDFAVEVIQQLGLKMPYRTALGMPNPITFYDDLFKLNR